MEDGPVLGGVDVIAGEHGVAAGLHPGGSGHAQQEPHRLVGDAVLGVIEHQITGAGSEAGGPLGVAMEELAQVPVTDVAEVRFERLPLGRGGEIHAGHSRGGGCRGTALDGGFTGSLRPPESPPGRMPPYGSKPWHFAGDLPLPLVFTPATACVQARRRWPPSPTFTTASTRHHFWTVHPWVDRCSTRRPRFRSPSSQVGKVPHLAGSVTRGHTGSGLQGGSGGDTGGDV